MTIGTIFTEDDRDRVRARLLDQAHADWGITRAAITGSAARGAEDRWSDIDLFFGVTDEIPPEDVLSDWSAFMYQELGALHHFDLRSRGAIYRAFLLPTCLEVDLAYTPAAAFGALGPSFQVVFGEAIERPRTVPVDRDHTIGLAWHHILHARVCIERNKLWQAEYWISAVRDYALTLACLRFGLPAVHAKGIDGLPPEVMMQFEDALVRTLTPSELRRALGVAATQFLYELREADAGLADRLEGSLLELTCR
ncbi:MAG: nucleotidyltransferase domain-containing protein [Chloroflexota bacterium]|nr:nucleotidyltransferase domain-containing protein [Chloroflexota bacterium]